VALEAAASHSTDTLSFALSPYPLSSRSSCYRESYYTPTIDSSSFLPPDSTIVITGFGVMRWKDIGPTYVREWRCVTGSTYPPSLINFLSLSWGITIATAMSDSERMCREVALKSAFNFCQIPDVILGNCWRSCHARHSFYSTSS
jgi:hypothetical protein